VIRVAIVDDHQVVRVGLHSLLSSVSDFDVVGLAEHGDAAIALAARCPVDVMLMDLNMPGTDGIAATRRVLDENPDIRVVVLTSFSDEELILRAIDAGAVGYLLKDADPSLLRDAIRSAANGDSPLAPRAARAVLAARGERTSLSDLSERERQVLDCLVAGMSNREIARSLEIAEKTVKAHLTSVFRRIGVSDRTQAALWAERHGMSSERPFDAAVR
jgi:DNA-binding NarL/FixJ family response regulator